MKIEFPKKYSVQFIKGVGFVEVPVESISAVEFAIKEQDWVSACFLVSSSISVFIRWGAYEITEEQAAQALARIIEEVMSPTPDVDTDVWDFDEDEGGDESA